MKGFNLHWVRMKVISILLVVALVLSPLSTLHVFGSETTSMGNDEVLETLSTSEIPTGSAIGVKPDSSNDAIVVTGSAITLAETTDHVLYYEDTEELIEMILQAEENGTIDQSPMLYNFGTEEVKEMFVDKYDALYYVDHREFPDDSSIYLFVDSVFDEKTGEREKLDLVFVMVNLTNNDQNFTVGVEGLEKVSMTTTAYSIVVPEKEKPATPATEEETTTTPIEEETVETPVEEETTEVPIEEETTEVPTEEETTEVPIEEETTEAPTEEETTVAPVEEETREVPTEEETTQLSISRNSVGMIKLLTAIDEIETTSTEEESTEASNEDEPETEVETETEIETEIETESESNNEDGKVKEETEDLNGSSGPTDSEEMKWEFEGSKTLRTSSDTLTADSNTAMVQSLSGLALFAVNLVDKYLGASFYDYSITGNNTNINSVISGLSGNSNSKLFIGTGNNNSAQNSYDSRDIVTLGIARDNLSSNGSILFNYTTVDLFPLSGNGVAGLTPYRGYGFPLKDVGNGYYEFSSFENHIYYGNYTTVDGIKNLTLLDGPDNISGYGTFFPLNNSSNESPNYYFGTKLTTSFLMPKDGMLGNDPMIFEFSGDDDVWVYINGKLALDLGGIHGIVNGNINFATGLVTIDKIASGSNGTQKAYWYLYNDYTSNTQATNAIRAKTGNNSITISKIVGLEKVDFATYDFTMYYMERGANISNFYIKLNFPMIETDKVSVVKDVQNMPVGTNDTYEFELWLDGNDEPEETITVAAGSIGTFDTEIPINESYFVKEISEGNYTTSWTTKIANTTEVDIKTGNETDELNIDEINIVKFINTYNPSGTLTIGKTVEGDSSDVIDGFDFRVTLKDKDNNLLTSIKVGDSTLTLEGGIYEPSLGNGDEITISELPIGTQYTVEELLVSDNPYYEISLEGIVREVETIGGTPAIVTDNPSNPVTGTIGVQNDDSTTEIRGTWSYMETSKDGTVGPITIGTYDGASGDVVWYRSDGTLATESDFILSTTESGTLTTSYIEKRLWGSDYQTSLTKVKDYNSWRNYQTFIQNLEAAYSGLKLTDKNIIQNISNSILDSRVRYLFVYGTELFWTYGTIRTKLQSEGYTVALPSGANLNNNLGSSSTVGYSKTTTRDKTEQELYNGGFKKLVYTYTEEQIEIPSTTVLLQNVEIVYTNSVNIILGSITIDKSLLAADATDTNSFIFKLTNTDEKSPGYGTTAFGSITVNQGNVSAPTFTFENLPMGTYEVKEMDHMRYELVSITDNGDVSLIKDSEATKYKEVKVVNKKVTDAYFSGSAIAVNIGTWTKNDGGEDVIIFRKKGEEV